MDLKKINEDYHLKDKLQKRVISESNFTYRNMTSILNKYLRQPVDVIDLGCGVGTLDFYLASKGNKITGVDAAGNAIKMARLNAKNLGVEENTNFIEANIEDFTSKKRYDVCVLTEVIEHVRHDSELIVKIKDLLKSSGLLILSTRSSRSPLTRLGITKQHDRNVGHLRRYTKQGLTKMIRGAGFKIVEVREKEGFLSEFLFSYPSFGSQIVRVANRFSTASKILRLFDDITLSLFGPSQLIVIAKKV
jgi:ubiquinone biosynthesis O-methyltransferase